MSCSTLTAKSLVELHRVFAFEVFRFQDADEFQISGHCRADVWQIREASELAAFDLCRVHGCLVQVL